MSEETETKEEIEFEEQSQEQDSEPSPAEADRASPTLQELDAQGSDLLPTAGTACERCPNSVWFADKDSLKCYCRVMFLITWDTKEPQVLTHCDGQYLAD